jgi:hypothetical protein
MNPQFLWCTLDGRAASGGEGQEALLEQLQAYAAIKSYGDMAHQPFGIVLEVGRAHAADRAPIAVSVLRVSQWCRAAGVVPRW